jgi:hypothetical protein
MFVIFHAVENKSIMTSGLHTVNLDAKDRMEQR